MKILKVLILGKTKIHHKNVGPQSRFLGLFFYFYNHNDNNIIRV